MIAAWPPLVVTISHHAVSPRTSGCVDPADYLVPAALPAHTLGGVRQPQHAPLLHTLHTSLHRPR